MGNSSRAVFVAIFLLWPRVSCADDMLALVKEYQDCVISLKNLPKTQIEELKNETPVPLDFAVALADASLQSCGEERNVIVEDMKARDKYNDTTKADLERVDRSASLYVKVQVLLAAYPQNQTPK